MIYNHDCKFNEDKKYQSYTITNNDISLMREDAWFFKHNTTTKCTIL